MIIGRNGVGKTKLLHDIVLAVANPLRKKHGKLRAGSTSRHSLFSRVVLVSFSSFDDFPTFDDATGRATPVEYIGLLDPIERVMRTPASITEDLTASIRSCSVHPWLGRWKRVVSPLLADPIFSEAGVAALPEAGQNLPASHVASIFGRLSAGHKVILLALASLVVRLEERSLVLVDEPEGHLHPPLLSAFIRSLSDLLVDRNAVGVIATHSPVVLQEVPSTNVWKMSRFGRVGKFERPQVETFGENVGVLTREVFALELTKTGFYTLIHQLVGLGYSYKEIVNEFSGKLGSEARALSLALIAERERGE